MLFSCAGSVQKKFPLCDAHAEPQGPTGGVDCEIGHDNDDNNQVEEMANEVEDEEFSSAMQAQDRPDKPPAPIDGGDNKTSADRRRTAVARGKQPEVDQPVLESFSN